MVFSIKRASIFDSDHECLVNTVNTMGAMGRGLALDFRFRVPEMYEEYKQLCHSKQIRIGKYWIYDRSNRLGKRILNFPTKVHYANPSKLSYVIEGLQYFKENYKEDKIDSIAFPLLGARNGRLLFGDVYGVMRKHLSDLPIDITVFLGNDKPDRFTVDVVDIINKSSDDFLISSLDFNENQIEKLRSSINKVISLADLLETAIFDYEQVQKIYDLGFDILGTEKSNIKLPA